MTNKELVAALPQLPWLSVASDDVIELVLDHHMMQTYRQCESRFLLEFVDGWSGRGNVWFLDFGIVFHQVVEWYYLNFREAGGLRLDTLLEYVHEMWENMELDRKYNTHPDYLRLGGLNGFKVMIAQYYGRFKDENERLRVIGAELYFGRKHEVPIVAEASELYPFRMYLSGKIDLLMDDGTNIGPMDHKTSKDFRGQNPNRSYEIQEGMTGYVYAAKTMVRSMFPDAQRTTNKIWMNYAQVKPETDVNKRFARLPIYKTDWQLEQYQLRQARTGQRLLALLRNYVAGGVGDQNTAVCNNWMHNECSFKEVHRQNTAQSQLTILNSSFVRRPIWNPEEPDAHRDVAAQNPN